MWLQAPIKNRDASVQVRDSWAVVEEMDFPRLAKLSLPSIEEPKDLWVETVYAITKPCWVVLKTSNWYSVLPRVFRSERFVQEHKEQQATVQFG